jgi:phosphate-selective porin OprO/OprP
MSSNDVHSYTAGIKWITDPNTRFMLDYVYTDFNKAITGSLENAATTTAVTPYSNEKAVNFRAQFDF